MKVLICGSRYFNRYDVMGRVMEPIFKHYYDTSKGTSDIVVISGRARGADLMGEEWAEEFNLPVEQYPADWNKYGKSAGYIRNKQMLEEGKPDLVVAFPIGESRGTRNMISLAEKANIKTIIVEEKYEEA